MHYDSQWLHEQSVITLERILPAILDLTQSDPDQALFLERLRNHFPVLFEYYLNLYGEHYDCHFHLEATVGSLAQAFLQRPSELRQLDRHRQQNEDWFQSQKMVGAVCYVDLYANDLAGIQQKIPYFNELGVTYLHLMPLFDAPELNSDGGYAVSSFRKVNPKLGDMDDLRVLTTQLREHGISLVLDFVFNHTADEHEWAKKALQGEKQYQSYYLMFDDRGKPDEYEPFLREIFPDQAPGSFTFRPEINKWVWTTFNTFQWDLNYSNPEVFRVMLEEMLYLANQGAEILRLDAVPFVWKQVGTTCENLPEAHWIIRAFNAFVQIACPALLFKSEAIVHPRDVRSYIDPSECQISYNPILMTHLWDALATRETFFMRHAMSRRFSMPENTAWINYVRSHDDIGWGFADEDASEVGINGFDHRRFLNSFYTGDFPTSFAKGHPFNYNPRTQDMRIVGTTASLAGLEQALATKDPLAVEMAVRRIVLIYSVVFSIGGIPLIYLGDELGTLNDYSYLDDPQKSPDSRWLHRPSFDQQQFQQRKLSTDATSAVFRRITHLISVRKAQPAFAGMSTEFFDLGNNHIFSYARSGTITVLTNFSEFPQQIDSQLLPKFGSPDGKLFDLISQQHLMIGSTLEIPPLSVFWLS